MMMTFKSRDINHRVYLNGTDKKLAEYLNELGLGKYAATVLATLRGRNPTQVDFMQIFNLEKSKNKKELKDRVYLFSWDNISEISHTPQSNEENKLIKFLSQKYRIEWVKTAYIEKIDNGNIIRVFTDKNNLSLRIDEINKLVHLIIDDGRTAEFSVEVKDGKLNICNRKRQKNQFKVAEGLSELREVRLFTWDEDNELRGFLFNHYNIEWVKTGVIERFVGGKSIRVVNGKNYLTLSLGDNWRIIYNRYPDLNSCRWNPQKYSTKVKLIIDDGRSDEFVGKMIGRPAKLIVFKNRGWLNEIEAGQFPEYAYKKYSLKIGIKDIIVQLKRERKEVFDKARTSENYEEIVDNLISLGIGRSQAKILAYLKDNEATSSDIVKNTGLHQSEVSIVMKELKSKIKSKGKLKEYDWISEREEKKPAKGRPYKVYSLKFSFNEIISQIETQKRKAINYILEKDKQLKELTST